MLFRRLVVGVACFLALLSLVIHFGFVLPSRYQHSLLVLDVVTVIFFLVLTVFRIQDARREGFLWRHFVFECLLVIALLVEFLVVRSEYAGSPHFSLSLVYIYLVSLQVYYICFLGHRMYTAGQRLFWLSFTPAMTVALSFIGLILLGTLGLLFPTATHGTLSPNISFIDALFTSTSAVCVTGLIVVDTATVFSRFGQCIILSLIQLGAFGIMIFVGFFAFSFGSSKSIRSKQVLQDILVKEGGQKVSTLLRVMLITTLSLELLGALFLIPGFYAKSSSASTAVFDSLFHSISAFCNAGFSTFSDSLERFSDSPWIVITTSLLIICGGIGFSVVYEFSQWIRKRLLQQKRDVKLSLHTITVIQVSSALFLIGMVAVLLSVDWSGRDSIDVVLSSLFQSVTARTAGFNTIPLHTIAPWGLLIMMILMLIGGAPGGTAGGIKVSTVGLLFHTCRCLLKGRQQVEIRHRTLPQQAIMMAFVISGLAVLYVSLATILLVWAEPDIPFFDLLFETISAFGTVGLSLGVTSQLSTLGKIILILTMYIGRVGPLTVFLALMRKRDEALYEYPSGSIVIG